MLAREWPHNMNIEHSAHRNPGKRPTKALKILCRKFAVYKMKLASEITAMAAVDGKEAQKEKKNKNDELILFFFFASPPLPFSPSRFSVRRPLCTLFLHANRSGQWCLEFCSENCSCNLVSLHHYCQTESNVNASVHYTLYSVQCARSESYSVNSLRAMVFHKIKVSTV